MDRKSIIVLVITFLLLIFWFPLVNKIWPPKPVPVATNLVESATNQLNTTNIVVSTQTNITALPPSLVPPPVLAGAEEKIEVIETAEARYIFSSIGGGLKSVELKKYPQFIDRSARKQSATNRNATLNEKAPYPVFAMPAFTPPGGKPIVEDVIFNLRKVGDVLIAEKTYTNGLRVIKGFKPESNYLMRVEVRFENTTEHSLPVPSQLLIAGTATPMGPYDNETMMGFYYFDSGKVLRETATSFTGGGCSVKTPLSHYESKPGSIGWSAAHNQFFTLAVMSREPARQLYADRVELPPPTAEELEQYPRANRAPFGIQVSLIYPGIVLGTDGTNRFYDRKFLVYAGPKEYRTLSEIAMRENNSLDEVMGFNNVLGGRFTGFFAKALLVSMNWLHNTFKLSYGLCIIAITIIIKILFWPLTQASTRSMKRMAALQPQMKEIQEKYKDDPNKMNQKLMQFMKENRVNPLGGCLPMLIQIPVFIGFYAMIQTAIELRGASFLWATDLSRPDTVAVIFGFPINPIPIIMGLTMLWQSKLTPVSPGMDPMQQKILKYMPLMFMVFLYNMSSGLTLYWTVQNLLSIAQMKLTKANEPAHPQEQPAVKKPLKKK